MRPYFGTTVVGQFGTMVLLGFQLIAMLFSGLSRKFFTYFSAYLFAFCDAYLGIGHISQIGILRVFQKSNVKFCKTISLCHAPSSNAVFAHRGLLAPSPLGLSPRSFSWTSLCPSMYWRYVSILTYSTATAQKPFGSLSRRTCRMPV